MLFPLPLITLSLSSTVFCFFVNFSLIHSVNLSAAGCIWRAAQPMLRHTSAAMLGSWGHIHSPTCDYFLPLPSICSKLPNFSMSILNSLLLFLWLTDPSWFPFITFAPYLSGSHFIVLTLCLCFLAAALLFFATCPLPTGAYFLYPDREDYLTSWVESILPINSFSPRLSPVTPLRWFRWIREDPDSTFKTSEFSTLTDCYFCWWWFELL